MAMNHRDIKQTVLASSLPSSAASSLESFTATENAELYRAIRGTAGEMPASASSLAISRGTTAADEKRQWLSESPIGTFGAALSVLALWIKRSRSRRELLHLADHELKDLRIYPVDVKIETKKWFWQA